MSKGLLGAPETLSEKLSKMLEFAKLQSKILKIAAQWHEITVSKLWTENNRCEGRLGNTGTCWLR